MYLKKVSDNKVVTNRGIIDDLFLEIKRKKYKDSSLAYSFIDRLKSKKRFATLKDFQYIAQLLNYNPYWAQVNYRKYENSLPKVTS